jgi:hypothetical protein
MALGWQVVALTVAIITLFSGVVIWAVRALLKFVMDQQEQRFKSIEETICGQRKDLAELRDELPREYMRKEDWNTFRDQVLFMTSIVDSKLDTLLARTPKDQGPHHA